MTKPKLSWGLLPVALLPAIFLGFAAWNCYKTYTFIKAASRAQGRVINLEAHAMVARGGISNVSYFPRIRYQTPGGQEIEFVSRSKGGHDESSPGSLIEVLYDPANPERARVNRFSELWESSLLFFGFGSFFIIFPLAGLYLYRRASKRDAAAYNDDLLAE